MTQRRETKHNIEGVWGKIDQLTDSVAKSDGRLTALEGKVDSGFIGLQRSVEQLAVNVREVSKPPDIRALWTAGVSTVALLTVLIGAIVAPLYSGISDNRNYIDADIENRVRIERELAVNTNDVERILERIAVLERRANSEGFTQDDGAVLREEMYRLRDRVEQHQLIGGSTHE